MEENIRLSINIGIGEFEKLIDILTVKEIFAITNINHTILREKEACGIRKHGSLNMRTPFISREECFKHIRIIKYINRYEICYKFEPISNDGTLEYIDVPYSPSWPGTVLVYYFNPDIVYNFTLYRVSVHSRTSSDFYDSKLSQATEIDFKISSRTIVTFSSIALSRLKLPYDTACNYIPGYPSVREWQLEWLNNLTMEHMNNVHTFDYVYEQYDYRIITPNKLNNISFHEQFIKLKSMVQGISAANCEVTYNIAETDQKSGNDGVRISLDWPKDTGVHVTAIPSYENIDFVAI